ncbi:MAG: DUF1778 domain-containing protein [Acidaminococcaceae bacterium]|nr:DUF1778 domain-containing protein [Acidaminococcaceae bacterium]
MEKETYVSPVKLQQSRKTEKYNRKYSRKNARITIRITEDGREKIHRMAKDSGQSVTDYILSRAFERPQLKLDFAATIAKMDQCMNHAMGAETLPALNLALMQLGEQFNRFKDELYKSYLTDIERANLKRREKKPARMPEESSCRKAG